MEKYFHNKVMHLAIINAIMKYMARMTSTHIKIHHTMLKTYYNREPFKDIVIPHKVLVHINLV